MNVSFEKALRRLLDDEGDELTSVDERLWTNRRNLAKNLPEQAISHLIDFHKTASQSQRHALIEATNISLIDKELEQVFLIISLSHSDPSFCCCGFF